MPKKKKNGPGAGGSVPPVYYSNPGSNRAASGPELTVTRAADMSALNRDEVVRNMQEMFSDLDPVVIYIVLSEADFKVENAMDALLELSGAATGRVTTPPPISGFEMAAAVLEPRRSGTGPSTSGSERSAVSDGEASRQELSPETTCLTEEFDSLIDQELETFMMPKPPPSSQSVPRGALLELDQLAIDDNTNVGSLSQRGYYPPARTAGVQGNTSPLDELSLGGACLPHDDEIPVDFSYLTSDSSSAVTRTSAFKPYHRPDQIVNLSEGLHPTWIVQASSLQPHVENPAFITPVVQSPNPWTNPPSVLRWAAGWTVSQAPLKPSATVPKSWMLAPQSRLRLEGQVLVLLRGAPGSGKSTLASAMLEQNPGGAVLSTDEYFTRNGMYCYQPDLLGEAHAWNHRRAKEAFERGFNPVIIDNTNMQCWEMKPYVALALKHKYRVLFREPNTWWKSKPRELEKRTKHGVTKEKIRRMLDNQDRFVSVQNIMASQPISTAVYGVDVPESGASQCSLQRLRTHPDLVGNSGFGKAGGHLSSSLPDVSSVDGRCSPSISNTDRAESDTESTGYKELAEDLQSELLDGAELDRELEASISLSERENVEANERAWEQCPESMGQRVRRERDRLADRDATGHSLSPEHGEGNLEEAEGCKKDESEGVRAADVKQLDFVGDWPSESLQQRAQRSRKSASLSVRNLEEDTNKPETSGGPSDSNVSGKTEFQKLLDLLQEGEIAQETTREDQRVLPDCVLDWKSGESSPLGDDGSGSQGSTEELESDQDASGVGTPEKEEGEKKADPSLVPDVTPRLESEVDFKESEVYHERKKGSSRKAGKSYRLALTFTNQSPFLAGASSGSPVDSSVQTDAQDFALLWRTERRMCAGPDWADSTRGSVILEGNPLRFVPKTTEEEPPGPQAIPYRVRHDKGSQVEENKLRELPIKQSSLEILRCHFKHVPLETLEDLFEKCHQDMEWTTNLLLDSGECLCRDEKEDASDQAAPEGLVQAAEEELLTVGSTEDTRGEVTVPQSSTENIADEPEDSAEVLEGSNHLSQPSQTASNSPTVSDPEPQSAPPQEDIPVSDLPEGSGWDIREEEDVEAEAFMIQEEVDAITQSLLTRLDELDRRREKERKEKERPGPRSNGTMNIQTLELKLTTELALQLTELFGPVGVSPGEFSPDDCSVLMDLNLAKLLHQKWKETIQERQRRAALTYQLLQESSDYWDESWPLVFEQWDSAAGSAQDAALLAERWSASRPPVSLRDIMMEEQVMQESLEKARLMDPDRKDGAALLKEKQLYALFPSIDRHFLRDIFRDHNYSLEQTQQFLHALLDDGPVRNVVAAELGPERNESRRPPSKERRRTEREGPTPYQDTEDPEYEDFRTEAVLQRRRQHESFQKAAEAYRQGRKDVAGFYAQQGHLHGHKVKEANHRAAVQIFERVNATLLPQNVLDLHGLHVDEALRHLQRVLSVKSTEWMQGLCRPQLSVITGRGNHSQGGVARIRPAVLDYLKNQNYRYTEVKPGLLVVTLH
ncbi:NEDD4-binding protein 2 [Trichomycterus rosablanca]|uniref:NEDD4-binding protein 2 n=1 Tax=Trichomycterus rosablanca TaxID=2290929 RepID=UPI002F35AEA7